MRSLMSVLFLVIFCYVQMTSSAPFAVNVAQCCFEFKNVKIPIKLVKSYHWTSSDCPTQAIVFQTVLGRKFCVDPKTTWVSGHVDKVDKRTTTATETNATTTTTAAASRTATETNATTTTTAAASRTATETNVTTTTATKTTATESETTAAVSTTTAKTHSLTV